MSLYTEIKTALIANLNTLNGSTVQAAQLTWGTPTPTNGQSNGIAVTQNTAIRITSTPGAAWTGTTVLLYNRLNLGDFKTLIGPTVKVSNVTTVYGLITAINAFYGLLLDTADFVDGPLDINSDGNGMVTLTPNANSLSWVGSWDIAIAKGDANLPESVSVTALNGLNYPVSNDTTTRLAPAVLYSGDWTANKSVLEKYQAGAAVDQALLDIINAVLPYSAAQAWVLTNTASAWTFYGATIVSNGSTVGVDYANSAKYAYVLVIKPGPLMTNIRGNFLVHYNPPIDPSVVG